MGPIRYRSGAIAASALAGEANHDNRSVDLARIKAFATLLLGCSVLIAIMARAASSNHSSFGYVAAWAEASAIGGLADWYAVVALFRHPCGVRLPHTAIIASDQTRIADSFGAFVEDQFLSTDAVAHKLRSVEFSALAAEWLADERRSLGLSRFLLRLAPQGLTAIEETGLRGFVAAGLMEQLRALELAPLAAKLLAALVEDGRHQRVFEEALMGKVLQTFIESNKQEVARFITDQIKSWDVKHMIDIIEVNIGRDLQFIRLNGALVGGIAGLGLYVGERAKGLR